MAIHDLLQTCRNIHAIGRNYRAHVQELQNQQPEAPIIFGKAVASLCSGSKVQLPSDLGPIHHEIEIILRIGKHLGPGCFEDLNCISHIGLGIDFTARTLQGQLKQRGLPWHRAKSFQDASYIAALRPFQGPWRPLHFSLLKNGSRVQVGNTENMIFSIPVFLRDLNQHLPLEFGDLIFTGTPQGVGPVHLGDSFRLQCPDLKIDTTMTPVSAPPAPA